MATPEFTALEQRGRKFKIRFGPAAALDWPATIIQMSLHCHHHQNHHRQKGMPAKFSTIVPAPPRSNPSPNTSKHQHDHALEMLMKKTCQHFICRPSR